jgi:epoxide hydrolase
MVPDVETAITPYTLSIPYNVLRDLQDRLSRTRFAQELPDARWDYGVPTAFARGLVERAQHGFD